MVSRKSSKGGGGGGGSSNSKSCKGKYEAELEFLEQW